MLRKEKETEVACRLRRRLPVHLLQIIVTVFGYFELDLKEKNKSVICDIMCVHSMLLRLYVQWTGSVTNVREGKL